MFGGERVKVAHALETHFFTTRATQTSFRKEVGMKMLQDVFLFTDINGR